MATKVDPWPPWMCSCNGVDGAATGISSVSRCWREYLERGRDAVFGWRWQVAIRTDDRLTYANSSALPGPVLVCAKPDP